MIPTIIITLTILLDSYNMVYNYINMGINVVLFINYFKEYY